MTSTAVVTGAAQGIGRAIASRLAQDGYELLLVDRNPLVEDVARALGGRHAVVDLRDEDAVLRLSDLAPDAAVLVNNAAVTPAARLLEVGAGDALDVFAVNVVAPLAAVRALAPALCRAGGAVVNLSSITARSYPEGTGLYSPSKAALEQLTRALAVELGPTGVRVNAVAPGIVPTEGTVDHYGDPDERRRRAEVLPLRRLGSPEDIAEAVAWLAGPASGWVTGQVLAVDGGFLAAHGHFFRLARRGRVTGRAAD